MHEHLFDIFVLVLNVEPRIEVVVKSHTSRLPFYYLRSREKERILWLSMN